MPPGALDRGRSVAQDVVVEDAGALGERVADQRVGVGDVGGLRRVAVQVLPMLLSDELWQHPLCAGFADLEIAFLFPWAVALGKIGLLGFWSMMIFLGVLTVGFIYEWKKGALEWE